MIARVAIIVSTALLVCACGATEDALKRRASYDLSCPEDRVTVRHLDANSKVVYGCGRSAPYVQSCSGSRFEAGSACHWSQDGEVTEQATVETTGAP